MYDILPILRVAHVGGYVFEKLIIYIDKIGTLIRVA